MRVQTRRRHLLAIAVALLATAGTMAAGCGDDDPIAVTPIDGGPDATGDATEAATVVPKGTRVLGIDVAPNTASFPTALAAARDGGASATNARFAWNDVEIAFDGGTTFSNPGLHITNLIVSAENTGLTLAFDAVDVGGRRSPGDLDASTFADNTLAQRYEAALDYAFDQTRDTKMTTLFVATDLDVALDASQMATFATFLGRVAAYARTARSPAPAPLRVGVVVTAAGIADRAADLAPVWAVSDVVGVSLLAVDAAGRARPPADVRADVDRIVASAPPGKPIELFAVGYPTSPDCGGSEAAQAEFVRTVFAAWDAHADRIGRVTFFEMEDTPEGEALERATRAGRGNDATFLAMLRSLGIARRPAFEAFRSEARARGF